MLPKRFITLLCLVSLIVPTTLAKKKKRKHKPTEFSKCKGKKCTVENLFESDPFEASEVRVQLEEDGPFAHFSSKALKAAPGSKREWYGEDDAGMFTMNLLEDENSFFGSATVGDTVYSFSHIDDETVMISTDINDYPPEGPSPDEDDALDGFENSTRSLVSSYEVGALRGQITEISDAEEPALNLNSSVRGEQNVMTPSDIGATSLRSENDLRALSASPSILDVMVVWTRNAECANAYQSKGCTLTDTTRKAILGRINLAVLETNVAFENSGIEAKVNLIHAYLDASYTEQNTDAFRGALNAITNPNDSLMDDVHVKREQYGADMVHFMIDDDKLCGIAWLGPSKSRMFSVSSWQCATGYYSFGHELAHNMVSSCAFVLVF